MRPHNLTEARRFLELLDPEGIEFTFQVIDDDNQRDSKQLRKVLHGSLDRHAARLIDFNNRGAGVFVTINRTTLRDRRINENIVATRAVFVDLDGSPLGPILQHHIKPHGFIETSPKKFHVYWKVSGLPLDQFKAVQKALAEKFDGDPAVCDLARVMRVPGFLHRKREPFQVRIVATSDTPAYPHTIFERQPAERHFSGDKEPATDRDVLLAIAALRVIPPTLTWHHRCYIGLATFRATDGSVAGLEAWCAWLRKSGSYSETHAIHQWKKYFKSPPNKVGLGTLLFLANAADPHWRDWLLTGLLREAV